MVKGKVNRVPKMSNKTKVKLVIIVLCIGILSITITSLLFYYGDEALIKDSMTDQTRRLEFTITTQMDYQWTDNFETESTEKTFQCQGMEYNESLSCSSYNCWFFDLFNYCIDSWINDGINHPHIVYNGGDCCFDIVSTAKFNNCDCYGCPIHHLTFINGVDLKPKLECYSPITNCISCL